MQGEALRLLLDQNVPRAVAAWLIQLVGPTCDVYHVMDVGLGGASDLDVFNWAQTRSAMIITYDEDFADQRSFPVGSHAGIIRLRVEPTTTEITCLTLERLFNEFEPLSLSRKLVIVDAHRVRIIG